MRLQVVYEVNDEINMKILELYSGIGGMHTAFKRNIYNKHFQS